AVLAGGRRTVWRRRRAAGRPAPPADQPRNPPAPEQPSGAAPAAPGRETPSPGAAAAPAVLVAAPSPRCQGTADWRTAIRGRGPGPPSPSEDCQGRTPPAPPVRGSEWPGWTRLLPVSTTAQAARRRTLRAARERATPRRDRRFEASIPPAHRAPP